ncbi:MAG: patatin-like phospholipase family protein [Myxococcota bacterium]
MSNDAPAADDEVQIPPLGTDRYQLLRAQLRRVLPRLVGPIEAGPLDDIEAQGNWQVIRRGAILFQQGELGDALYIVLSGRLEIRFDDGEEERIVGYVGRGEVVGEMSVFTEEPRTGTAVAIRNSVLVRFSAVAFKYLCERYPQILMFVSRVVVRRSQSAFTNRPISPLDRQVVNVVLMPADGETPVRALAERLAVALRPALQTVLLDAERAEAALGAPLGSDALGAAGDLRLMAWLEEQEARHDLSLYIAGTEPTPWTQRCIQRADLVLHVACADGPYKLASAERVVVAEAPRPGQPRRALVLIHTDPERPPYRTARWIDEREVDQHLHMRWNDPSDMARLARFVTNRSVGLVLGGGGARGFAHFGAYEAIQNAGIVVDMYGGTSMGAVIALQCALGWSRTHMLEVNRANFIDRRLFQEYTLPLMAVVRGGRMERALQEIFAEQRIEDLWLPFFCVSTNLTKRSLHVHRRGSLVTALRATTALPGIVTPVVANGDILVDGGVLNNLPGDIMRRYCAKVLGVDVATPSPPRYHGKHLPSPWMLVARKLFDPERHRPFPTIVDIIMTTILLGSEDHREKMQRQLDLYIPMPLPQFGFMQFEAIEALIETGEQEARRALRAWPQRTSFLRDHAEAGPRDAPTEGDSLGFT